MFVYGEAPSSFKINESLENNGLSNFPVELRLKFLLWDPVGPPKGSQRVPGGPREFGEDPSRPKIEKKMHFVFFNF